MAPNRTSRTQRRPTRQGCPRSTPHGFLPPRQGSMVLRTALEMNSSGDSASDDAERSLGDRASSPGNAAHAPDLGQDATVGWVLSYFGPEQSAAADSLHLAYSTD